MSKILDFEILTIIHILTYAYTGRFKNIVVFYNEHFPHYKMIFRGQLIKTLEKQQFKAKFLALIKNARTQQRINSDTYLEVSNKSLLK